MSSRYPRCRHVETQAVYGPEDFGSHSLQFDTIHGVVHDGSYSQDIEAMLLVTLEASDVLELNAVGVMHIHIHILLTKHAHRVHIAESISLL